MVSVKQDPFNIGLFFRVTHARFAAFNCLVKKLVEKVGISLEQVIPKFLCPCYLIELVTRTVSCEVYAQIDLPKLVSKGRAERDRDRPSTRTSTRAATWQGF